MAMASIPPSYYHASAAIPTANHSDFFNTHEMLRQQTANKLFLAWHKKISIYGFSGVYGGKSRNLLAKSQAQ